MSSRTFGCAGFGLKDCMAIPNNACCFSDFYLADAVLPVNPFGTIRVGDEAEKERTHTGLHWPREAQVTPKSPLRRVPIPFAWKALVESGETSARWNVGRGVSFPIEKIIATHVFELIKQSKAGFNKDSDQLSLAIPNHLDEYGQEALLRELNHVGVRNAQLIWRPVAAALAWLAEAEGDFVTNYMTEDDHIHVIYLGPDAVEFTTLKLKPYELRERTYILPLRDRPQSGFPLTGMDWAGEVIEKSLDGIDVGAFWQAFTTYPDVWSAIAGRNISVSNEVWSVDSEWRLWSPRLIYQQER